MREDNSDKFWESCEAKAGLEDEEDQKRCYQFYVLLQMAHLRQQACQTEIFEENTTFESFDPVVLV
jgi:hypothetical protein